MPIGLAPKMMTLSSCSLNLMPLIRSNCSTAIALPITKTSSPCCKTSFPFGIIMCLSPLLAGFPFLEGPRRLIAGKRVSLISPFASNSARDFPINGFDCLTRKETSCILPSSNSTISRASGTCKSLMNSSTQSRSGLISRSIQSLQRLSRFL